MDRAYASHELFFLLGLTQLACCASAERYAPFQSCAVFPRYARKNRTQKIGKYLAAAGKKRGVVTRKNAPA